MDPPVGRAAMVAPSERLFYTHTGGGTHARGKSVKRDAFSGANFSGGDPASLRLSRDALIFRNKFALTSAASNSYQSMVINGRSNPSKFVLNRNRAS